MTLAAALRDIRFLGGAVRPDQLPADQGYEVAFAGRSNAGKSSALNVITGVRSLARTSKTPGRTREINFFAVDAMRRLVDLPGYGYAKVPAAMQRQWAETVDRYLETRSSLRGIVLVMDVRHPFTHFDQRLMAWATAAAMPVHLLLTKADKLSAGRAKTTLLSARQHVADNPETMSAQLFSALKRTGVEQMHAQLAEWLDLHEPQ